MIVSDIAGNITKVDASIAQFFQIKSLKNPPPVKDPNIRMGNLVKTVVVGDRG